MYLTLIERKCQQVFSSDYSKMEYARKVAKRKNYLVNLDNRQVVHSMICEMAGGCKREYEKLLYKVVDGKASRIMIQSRNPLKSNILDEFGYVKLSEVEIDEIYDKIVKNGVILNFKACLAPTIKVKDKVRSIEVPDERLAWVKRKLDNSGVKVLKVFEVEHEAIRLSHRNDISHSFFNGYSYVGQLEVLDRENFLTSIFDGIGRAKSYGAGLVILSK